MNRLKLQKLKGRDIAIGASVLAHGVALAFFISQPEKPKNTQMAMEFAPEPEVLQQIPKPVVEEPKPQLAVKPAGSGSSSQGESGRKSKRKVASRNATARNFDAILAMDLDHLRSTNVMLVSYSPDQIGNRDLISAVEPDVHLSQADVDAIIQEGRGDSERGNKSRGDSFIGTVSSGIGGGRGSGGGGGGGGGHCPPDR